MTTLGPFKLVLLVVWFETYLVSAEPQLIDPSKANVIFYHGPTHNDYQSYPLANAGDVVNHPKFTHNKTTCFIVDYYEPQLAVSYYDVDAYNKADEANFLYIDWGTPMVDDKSKVKKPDVVKLVPIVGDWMLEVWESIGAENFHILSYARGVSFSTLVCRYLTGKSNGETKLGRLTALDPPKPDNEDAVAISPTEVLALFFDAIHTSAGADGIPYPIADADFWPNNGTASQPGCDSEEDHCSRRRSFMFWAESVGDQDGPQFCSYSAENYDQFLSTDVSLLGEPVLMGINCDKSARGNFYLKTNDAYPYAQG